MSMTIYENVTDAFVNELAGLVNYGSDVQLSSRRWTRERININFSIKNRLNINTMVNCIPGIDINVPFMIADFYDIWEGGNPGIAWYYHSYNLEFLETFGEELRYSYSYGDRFRNYGKNETKSDEGKMVVDQIKNTLKKLREDPTTRRAVMMIWNPHADSNPKTWNVPCNDMVQFLIRNNQIHLHLHIRSQDIFSGFNYDLTHFMLMQQIFAELLERDIGLFHYTCGSFHYYDYMEELANKIHANQIQYTAEAEVFTKYLERRDLKFKECWRYINVLIENIKADNTVVNIDPLKFWFDEKPCFLYDVYRYFKVGHLIKQNRLDEAYETLRDEYPELYHSYLEYLMYRLLAQKAMKRGKSRLFLMIREKIERTYPQYYNYFLNFIKMKNGLGIKIRR